MGWATPSDNNATQATASGGWGDSTPRIAAVIDSPIGGEEPSTTTEAEQIDVAATMGPQEPQSQGEIYTGTVEGPGTGQPPKRGRRTKDPLKEMLKHAKFGQMAVVCHTLMYRALSTPEKPCPDLAPEEAEMIDTATTAYVQHVLERSPSTGPYIPIAALMLANLIPVLNRSAIIVPATVPFWKRVGNGVASVWNWTKSRVTRKTE